MIYRILAGVGVVAVVGSIIWYLYNDNQQKQLEIELLQAEKIQIENALEVTNETLDQVREDAERQARLVIELNERMTESRQRVEDLRETFNESDLEALAAERGQLIEDIINDGTQEAFDELECVTDPSCMPADN